MVHKVVLENGVTVVVEEDPRFRTLAYAVCVRGGISDEAEQTVGLTHLAEHLLFKQTKSRTAHDIATSIDLLGGEVNAFTDLDCLCVGAAVPAQFTASIVELSADLVLHATPTEADVEREKEIIRQEIIEASDDPSDALHCRVEECCWAPSIYRYPVFGTLDSLSRISLSDVVSRLHELRCGSRFVIAAAGPVAASSFTEEIRCHFGALPKGMPPSVAPVSRQGGIAAAHRPVRQVYFAYSVPWPQIDHPHYAAGLILSAVLGEGVSSRLFRRLREKEGLVYDIGTALDTTILGSSLVVSGITEHQHVPRVLRLLAEELRQISESGCPEEEVGRAVSMIGAQVEMETDSVAERLSRLLETELYVGRYVSGEEFLEKIRRQSAEIVSRAASAELSRGRHILCLLGDVSADLGDTPIPEWMEKLTGGRRFN